ncbi:MAG: FAD/NAD(P)-binding oxidoreductase, partial [Campylobacterota bacterium]|nr:FAD/NAD(P)-binding oxidoreductase [Campylobacterota bacterium]
MENLKTDILIIGAGPAGLVAAATASENYPDKQITIVKEFEKGQVPCGIPYVFGNILGDVGKNAMPCGGDIPNIKKVVDKVIKVDVENKIINGKSNTFEFDKLIFATGSIPFVHQNLQNSLECENVFTIHKSYEEVDKLKRYLENKQKVVVIGTGFIGVELAEQLQDASKEVTIVGGRHILANSFDEDMAVKAEDIMEQKGIKLA